MVHAGQNHGQSVRKCAAHVIAGHVAVRRGRGILKKGFRGTFIHLVTQAY